MKFINIYIMILILLSLSYLCIIMLSIKVCIIFIIHDLSTFGIAKDIQVIDSFKLMTSY